jgi:hypothetical protein
MGIVRFEHGLNATPMSIGHDFGFAAPHRDAVTRNSHAGISSFPGCDVDRDEITQIAMIRAIFESAGRPPTYNGNQHAKNACLALQSRTYRYLSEAIMSQRSSWAARQNRRGIRK